MVIHTSHSKWSTAGLGILSGTNSALTSLYFFLRGRSLGILVEIYSLLTSSPGGLGLVFACLLVGLRLPPVLLYSEDVAV